MRGAPRAASAWPSDGGRNRVQPIGRLVQSADFQRLLAAPPCSRSAHFAVHHLGVGPMMPRGRSVHASSTDLSTGGVHDRSPVVDSLASGYWLGCVVPKRHARRSVTRNLLRRQIRVVMTEHHPSLQQGLWLVRLRSPFAREQFPSAASDALRDAARKELSQVFSQAARRMQVRVQDRP